MKIVNIVGAATIAAATLASSAAFAVVPGSNFYFDRSDEISRQAVAGSTVGAPEARTTSDGVPGSRYYIRRGEELARQDVAASPAGAGQGTVQSFGYAAGTETPRASVPGSSYFIDRGDELTRQQVR